VITETKIRKIEPDITMVEICGRLNLGNSLVSIESSLKRLIEQGARKLVVDLGAVKYIDSSGIGMLVSCYGAMNQAGGRIRIAGTQGSVAKAFHLVHLDRIIPFDADAETACRNIGIDGAAAS
jgi:anti-sigma B factor antagonist